MQALTDAATVESRYITNWQPNPNCETNNKVRVEQGVSRCTNSVSEIKRKFRVRDQQKTGLKSWRVNYEQTAWYDEVRIH